MSDDSPWKPPVIGGNDESDDQPDGAATELGADAAPDRTDREAAPSPWARDPAPSTPDVTEDAELPWERPTGTNAAPGAGAPGQVEPPPSSSEAADASDVATVAERARPAPSESSGLPVDATTDDARGTRRPSTIVALAAVAIVAVGVAAIFAVRTFTGETTSGADTPEQLGDELMAAVDAEDVLGMIDVLLPGERDTLGQPFVDLVAELRRLEVLAPDLDLSGLAGVDVQLSNRVVAVAPTNVDDIVMLDMTADVVAVVDGAEIPIGPLITDRMPDEMLTEMRGSSTTETDRLDVSLAGVREDGRWYISLGYTAAEALRSDEGSPAIPDEGIGAVGAESPEAAADTFFDRIERFDLRGLLQGLDPYEAQALQRYAPLFLDDAAAELEAAAADMVVHVTDRGVRFDGSGSERTMFVESFGIDVGFDDTTIAMTYGDGCTRMEFSDDTGLEPIEQCGVGTDTGALEDAVGADLPPSVEAFLTALGESFSDMEPVGIELRERDGAWFLSPVATGTEAMLAAMRALDRGEVDRLVDLGGAAADDALGMLFGAWDAVDTATVDDGSIDDGWTTDDGSFDDTVDLEPSPVDDCYAIVDTDEAMSCFDELVEAGAAEEWQVPVALRAPECGLSASLWTGSVFEMGDDEFTATMSGARPCYADLVATGLDEWAVPYEVVNVDCFEGRNPYRVVDDVGYADRVFACVTEGADE